MGHSTVDKVNFINNPARLMSFTWFATQKYVLTRHHNDLRFNNLHSNDRNKKNRLCLLHALPFSVVSV